MGQRLNRISFVVFGVCSAIFGFGALFQRSFWDPIYAQYIDLGYYHELLGFALIVVGAACVWLGLRRSSSQQPDEN